MTISPRAFCEAIYCGIAPKNAFERDPVTRRIAFVAHVTDRGQTRAYHVVFEGVRDLDRNVSAATRRGRDDPLELSMIELEREVNGWRVWFNPWYVDEIEFRCDQIQLDGTDVIGSGRWLQDDLPSRPAG